MLKSVQTTYKEKVSAVETNTPSLLLMQTTFQYLSLYKQEPR